MQYFYSFFTTSNEKKTEVGPAITPKEKESVTKTFEFPLHSFANGRGEWLVNGEVFHDQNSANELVKEILSSKKVYLERSEMTEDQERKWVLVVETRNNNFVFMEAVCDHQGFSSSTGKGSIRIASSFDYLWTYHLNFSQRKAVNEYNVHLRR